MGGKNNVFKGHGRLDAWVDLFYFLRVGGLNTEIHILGRWE